MANLVDYTNVNWKDYPNTDTPVTATNLNVMDTGIAKCANAVNTLNSTKQDASTAITTSNIGSQTVTGINDGSYAYTPTTIKNALSGKQDASTAITTSNISSQTVKGINDGSASYTPSSILAALNSKYTMNNHDSNNLVTNRGDANWNNGAEGAFYGIQAFHYEGADTSTYVLPCSNCDVFVWQSSQTRGSAIAIEWLNNSRRVFVNGCHGTWADWTRIY